MIVWSGWGIVVPVFVVVAFFAVVTASGLAPSLDPTVAREIGYAVTGLISAVGVFFFARFIENKPGRAFTDNATGKAFQVKPSAGSLFFIPTRYWPYILVVAGLALAANEVFNPSGAAALRM